MSDAIVANAAPLTPLEGPHNGGQILVDALRRHGVDTVYCVPGESYLPVLDALHGAAEAQTAPIRTYVTRHEGAAANMADAYGKLTGRPGICFVTRGPGATHASIGVHTASQDSTPMILFIGQVELAFMGREGFQEVDYRQMFGGMAKWVVEIDDLRRIPEIVARAFSVALSGRQGPVVVALPETVLFGTGQTGVTDRARSSQAAPRPADMAALRTHLGAARKPLLLVGGSGWDKASCAQLRQFAERHGLPVAASFRRQDLFDNRLPQYIGQVGLGISPKLAERVKEADLLIAVGTRMSEVTSGAYTLIESPVPKQTLIHVHADPNELGRVYQAALPINAGVREFTAALADLEPLEPSAATTTKWQAWTTAAREDYQAHSTPAAPSATTNDDYASTSTAPTYVDLSQVVSYLSETLPDDAVISNGAGNYTVWVHRYYRYRQHATELAPTSGAMGYGFPAAIAAKLEDPNRTVVCFAGDGCFMMYPQELATAMQYGAAVIILVVNNGMLGTIRMHQEREYPGRVSGTTLANPDFVALARSFGAFGERVHNSREFPSAFSRAQASGLPALIELCTDPAQITPAARIKA